MLIIIKHIKSINKTENKIKYLFKKIDNYIINYNELFK